MKMIHACAILVLLAGCSQKLEEQIIPDTNRNPAKFVLDVKPAPKETKPSPHAAPPEAPSVLGNPVRKPEPGGGVQPKPSNPTGLNHSPDAGKMVQKPAEVRKKILKYHTALRNCAACTHWHPWAVRQRDKKTLLIDLEIVEYANPDEAFEKRPELPGLPCFELVDTFGQHHFRTLTDATVHLDSAVCPGCLNIWLKWNGKPPGNVQFDRPADVRVAAAATVGAVKARPMIRTTLDLIRKHVGENVPFGIVWERNGKQIFELLRNQDFSMEALLGSSSTFRFSAKGAKNLPTDAGWIRYEDNRDGTYEVTASAKFKKFTTKAPGASAEPAGFADPATLGLLISLGKGLWAVLHPKADIQIGGRVGVTGTLKGDTLGIDFNGDFPRARLEWVVNFLFGVRRIELSADKCRILFVAENFWSRWVPFVPKERTILISE